MPEPAGIENALEETYFTWLRFAGEEHRGDLRQLGRELRPLLPAIVFGPAFQELQPMPAAEVRLPADPFITLAGPGAVRQIDDGLFAPFRGLESELAE